MADNTIANAIKFLKGEEKSLPATKTEGQVYFAYRNVGTEEKPSYTGAIYIDTPIGGTQNRIKMTAHSDVADKALKDSSGSDIRETYLSNLEYTDDGKQIILIKGSGNNQTKVALPIASTTKSGIITVEDQSFSGTKTFTTINSTNLTVTGSGGFSYTGIETATGDKARPVWFAYDGVNGKPVVDTNFTYNPATQTLEVANLLGTAKKAINDNNEQDICSTYVKYKSIKFSAVSDKVYLLESNGANSATAVSGPDISTAIIPAATDKAAGVITTGIQTFSGNKTFNDSVTINDCLTSKNINNTIITKLTLFSTPRIENSSTSAYFKELLKWICINYTNKVDYLFKGRVAPNSFGSVNIFIYNTDDVDSTTGLPKFSSGTYTQVGGTIYTFGTNNYVFYFRTGFMTDDNYAGSESVGGAAISANKLNTDAGSLIQPVYFLDGKPTACTYTLEKSVPKDAEFTDTWRGIQNNLTSTSTVESLSALQGKLLNERIQKETYLLDNLTAVSNISDIDTTTTGTYICDNTKIIIEKIGVADSSNILRKTILEPGEKNIKTSYQLSVDSGQTWKDSYVALNSLNYTDYTVNKEGLGASGTWGIDISGSSASCTGNAATATKFQTPRTITFEGSITGSASFDGSNDITITTSSNLQNQYLPLAGGTMTGTIEFPRNKLACRFGHLSNYSGIIHKSGGDEALMFMTDIADTSFIFKTGQSFDNIPSWSEITPSMQIKRQSVYINSLISNGRTPHYNLYINGATRCNGTLGVGDGSKAEIDFFPSSSSGIRAKIKVSDDRIEFVFS